MQAAAVTPHRCVACLLPAPAGVSTPPSSSLEVSWPALHPQLGGSCSSAAGRPGHWQSVCWHLPGTSPHPAARRHLSPCALPAAWARSRRQTPVDRQSDAEPPLPPRRRPQLHQPRRHRRPDPGGRPAGVHAPPKHRLGGWVGPRALGPAPRMVGHRAACLPARNCPRWLLQQLEAAREVTPSRRLQWHPTRAAILASFLAHSQVSCRPPATLPAPAHGCTS